MRYNKTMETSKTRGRRPKIEDTSLLSDEQKQIAHLLELSLAAPRLGGNEFLEKGSLYLLERYKTLCPDQPVELSSDESFLVRLAAKSLKAAADYVELFGPCAWTATSRNPVPLTDLLEVALSGLSRSSEVLSWSGLSSSTAGNKSVVERLLRHGLRHAMPVRNREAPDLLTPSSIRRAPMKLSAQIKLISLLQRPDQLLSVKDKLNWFKDNDGLWVCGINSAASFGWKECVEADVFQPETKVLLVNVNSGDHHYAPWINIWQRTFKDDEAIISRLDDRFYDLPAISIARLHALLDKQPSWEKAKTLLDATQGGWQETRADKTLLWQHLLTLHPEWFSNLLSQPAARLRQVSPSGMGIWHCLWKGWSEQGEKKPPSSAPLWSPAPKISDIPLSIPQIVDLHKKVPLPAFSVPLLFDVHKAPLHIEEMLFNATAKDNLVPWVGLPDDRQAPAAAAYLLEGLLIGQKGSSGGSRMTAAQRAVFLYRAWRQDPSALSPATVAVLWCAREYLSMANLKLVVDVSELMGDTDLPVPSEGTTAWIPAVDAAMEKEHDTVTKMRIVLRRASMQASVAPALASRRAGPPKL